MANCCAPWLIGRNSTKIGMAVICVIRPADAKKLAHIVLSVAVGVFHLPGQRRIVRAVCKTGIKRTRSFAEFVRSFAEFVRSFAESQCSVRGTRRIGSHAAAVGGQGGCRGGGRAGWDHEAATGRIHGWHPDLLREAPRPVDDCSIRGTEFARICIFRHATFRCQGAAIFVGHRHGTPHRAFTMFRQGPADNAIRDNSFIITLLLSRTASIRRSRING